MSFGTRLTQALDDRGSLCVGIDPHPGLLDDWGLDRDADGLRRFADICVRAFAGVAAVVKPQSAFFESYGSRGIGALEASIEAARAAGAIVLLDVKRGDIGTTMAAYAQAYLDPASPLGVDAITVSPYLGIGSLQPVFEACAEHGGGAFVLALTSNPEGPQVQHARAADGRMVAQVVLDELAARNATSTGLGSFGAVVGATVGAVDVDLGSFNGPFLVPGVGAQGGTSADVREMFGTAARGVLPSLSREILRHGPDVGALRTAAERAVADFAFLRD